MKISQRGKSCLFVLVLLSLLFAIAGCDEEDAPEVLTKDPIGEQSETAITGLLQYQGTYLGDSTRVKEILKEQLPAKEFVTSYDITLNRLTITYGLPKDTELTEEDFTAYWTQEVAEEVIFYNSSALFSLVNNLESIEFNIDGYPLPTYLVTKTAIDEFYGQDVKTLTTAADWAKVIVKTSKGNHYHDFFKENPLKEKEKEITY